MILSPNFGISEAGEGDGDLNGDGLIDFADVVILSEDVGALFVESLDPEGRSQATRCCESLPSTEYQDVGILSYSCCGGFSEGSFEMNDENRKYDLLMTSTGVKT